MFKKIMIVSSIGLILVFLAAACSPSASPEISRLDDLEAKVDALAGLQTDLNALKGEVAGLSADQVQVADLQSKLDGLQAQMDGVATEIESMSSISETGAAGAAEHNEDSFAVSMAQYVLDTAGFHGMAETITETQQIDPAYLGTVNRVHKILASAPWPESLAEQGQAFVSLLDEFAASLEADDVKVAAQLSDEVHDAQHELSHAIDAWLGAEGKHEE